MTTTVDSAREARREALVAHIFHAVIGMQDVIHIYLGDQLGLYTALAAVDSASPTELATRAGIAERYAREWLEQQAVAGIIDVADGRGVADPDDPRTRRYRLPPGAEDVLCDPESLYHLTPLAPLAVSVAQTLPRVIEAFRTGGGVPYEAYGGDAVRGISRINRPMFDHQLATEWLPELPDIEARLRRPDPPARIADIGCGTGWSAIAMAQAYPTVRVDGIDLDIASLRQADRNAASTGVTNRVSFACRDATHHGLTGPYDLVTFFETLHDMARPVEALRAARDILAPGGAVLVGDERVSETFTAPGDDVDRFHYGWSAPHCLAVAMIEPGAAGTGTVMRPGTLRRYAHQAGFANFTILPIDHDFWRFYRLG